MIVLENHDVKVEKSFLFRGSRSRPTSHQTSPGRVFLL